MGNLELLRPKPLERLDEKKAAQQKALDALTEILIKLETIPSKILEKEGRFQLPTLASNIRRNVEILDPRENRKRKTPFWTQELAAVDGQYDSLLLRERIANFVEQISLKIENEKMPKFTEFFHRCLKETDKSKVKQHSEYFRRFKAVVDGTSTPDGSNRADYLTYVSPAFKKQLSPDISGSRLNTEKAFVEYAAALDIARTHKAFGRKMAWLNGYIEFLNVFENKNFDKMISVATKVTTVFGSDEWYFEAAMKKVRAQNSRESTRRHRASKVNGDSEPQSKAK